MRDRRYVEDLTTHELEEVLLVRRREERLARLQRLGAAGRMGSTVVVPDLEDPLPVPGLLLETADQGPQLGVPQRKSGFKLWRERVLLAIEIAVVVGLVAILISFAVTVRDLNRDWREQQSANPFPTPTATPLIRVAILPGGHKPPTASGGEAQPLGPVTSLAIPTPGPRSPTRLVIQSIGVDVPVVEGDGWEQLKRGAGHHIGSANPGERGNCFISGHNDIYGEIFRDLEEVKAGDQIVVHADEQPYVYIVRTTRIVEPDDVSVMYPTSTPILTLLTCYPYMVDSHRLVVIAELDQ